MQAYLEYVSLNHPGVRYAVLMSKAHLLGMYASCGFSIVGLSPVVLGKDQWFEMLMDFDAMEPRALRFVQVWHSRATCTRPRLSLVLHTKDVSSFYSCFRSWIPALHTTWTTRRQVDWSPGTTPGKFVLGARCEDFHG